LLGNEAYKHAPRLVPAAHNQPQRPGDWNCPSCGDLQFGRNQVCRKCGCPKPAADLCKKWVTAKRWPLMTGYVPTVATTNSPGTWPATSALHQNPRRLIRRSLPALVQGARGNSGWEDRFQSRLLCCCPRRLLCALLLLRCRCRAAAAALLLLLSVAVAPAPPACCRCRCSAVACAACFFCTCRAKLMLTHAVLL